MQEKHSEQIFQFTSKKASIPILLFSVCIIAICGILYELLISTISSYFLGSSVLHFSVTIGLFLSFMGVGAYISRFIGDKHLLNTFIMTEIYLGLVGGASGVILYSSYALTQNYYLIAFLLLAVIGSLVGIEIPLLTRLIQKDFQLKDTLAQVLSFDYLGALVASLLFPLILLPYLGLTRTSFFIGLLNLSVAFLNILIFRKELRYFLWKLTATFIITIIYTVGFFYAFGISQYFEQFLYSDEIIFSKQSSYQRIVMTRWKEDLRLYINGNLQFSSLDEHRYHEPLVHLPIALANQPENVLLLGAGDGIAVREILKHEGIKQIDLVDLDPLMTELASKNVLLKRVNADAMNSPKVKIIHQDAYKYIENSSQMYSVIIIDLPDPNDVGLGKLYTKEFYQLVKKRLAKDGIMITQATSPYLARNAFWCIYHSLEEVFPTVIPVNVHLFSFGQWGFHIAMPIQFKDSINTQKALSERIEQQLFKEKKLRNLRFLNKEILPTLFVFDKDVEMVPTLINTLETQALVQYYEDSWIENNE
jgi:spermidine synthase